MKLTKNFFLLLLPLLIGMNRLNFTSSNTPPSFIKYWLRAGHGLGTAVVKK